MVQQVTNGIKISAKSTYNGILQQNNQLYYSFNYYIYIENESQDTVKLTRRFWTIYDSLSNIDFVEGEGVVGQTPILHPKDQYTYRSNCFLSSTFGAMKGFYKMIDIHTQEEFLVAIPTFQLTTTPSLN
ncbi:Putative ApaG protein associated with Co2+ and Mg2+ efflux [Tenacibaculum maritimum]|uniref:Co2+/Mg2+ efflux protein ApaG n=1 Tax=Tenacibaculum maritimum TaxID=107401 RepID=UPI0012E67425|nr:Co2+/Mg2+ efflux protein ApaG [Tenacibaculum maritimum]CAA0159913.1 Putative ApaG protein associated with Co2+ and Mg2+ efflux [Tenacibaculum maritimum]CAA0183527.1 Putative ApaG protein associated with Co2+ and Mg2+ efflux [Tenacibaculum maritimum]CAA0236838.1 Putative ApaG protein associated with Co2+ and Mg2+ efflux [Tenacibaculum maritimum]